MVIHYYTAVVCCFIVLSAKYYGASAMGDADLLLWAPFTTVRSPFVTFANDFNRPTWVTKHQNTKVIGRLHLNLPKNVPFAVVCGACFQHSSFKPSLTIQISDHNSKSVQKMRRGSTEYDVGLNKCIMNYMITEPIRKNGEIKCTLNRGKRVTTETLKFSAVEVKVQEPPEEYEIRPTSSMIKLQCPDPEPSPVNNPVVNVWHEEQKNEEGEEEAGKKNVGTPILFTNQTINLEKPQHTVTLVCSVYHIFNPRVVHQRRYKILGRPVSGKPQHQVAGKIHAYQEPDAEILAPRISLSTSILAVIIIAALVCVLIALIGAYRFVSAFRRKS